MVFGKEWIEKEIIACAIFSRAPRIENGHLFIGTVPASATKFMGI
ncbi:MAG: hypothetical protein WA792_02995 [Pseudolabrys sp.]